MPHHKLIAMPQPPPFQSACLLCLMTVSQNVTLSPSVIKHHAMKEYEKVVVHLHSFLTSEFTIGIDIGTNMSA
jgi:hypothetical protein